MFYSTSRRGFLRSAAIGGAALGLGDLGFLSRLPRVNAQETQPAPTSVQFLPEIEPLVRLLEETERGKLLEVVAQRIRSGLSYRELLAALMLAAVRNIQPRPQVGFKFHGVLVVNSAHLASMSSPDEHRWLPIFWALDYFKATQAQDISEGDWTMAPVNESAVPPPDKARAAFLEAMNRWDVEAADAAVAGLARTAGGHEVYEMFFALGARDFRSIGHKAIFVANSCRTLECIGWQHAEPIVRSLAYALLNHTGQPNPAQSDLPNDRAGRRNQELLKKFRPDWASGRLDSAATRDLLAVLRSGSSDEACDKVLEMVSAGVHPQSIWDGLLVGGGELLFRQRGIVALHALTTGNALRYAYDATSSDTTRRFVMLQYAAFLPQFREAMAGRGNVADFKIDQVEPAPLAGQEPLAEIFADLSGNRELAARKVLSAVGHVTPEKLIETARVLVFLKGNDSHDYKFSSAVLEDYYHVSPAWRDKFLAAGVFNLHGSGDRDNALVKRTRAALQA
jgi:hypothetical protein